MNMHPSLLAAAVGGILLGAACGHSQAAAPEAEMPTAASPAVAVEPHACKGQNACKGQGSCKTDANACKGQNACQGKGGCKSS